jgi:hypothetical protein
MLEEEVLSLLGLPLILRVDLLSLLLPLSSLQQHSVSIPYTGQEKILLVSGEALQIIVSL